MVMSKIVEIKVNYGRTIKTRPNDYQFLRLDIEMKAVVEKGENSQEVLDDLQAYAALEVKEWAKHELNEIEKDDKSGKSNYKNIMNETSAEDYF